MIIDAMRPLRPQDLPNTLNILKTDWQRLELGDILDSKTENTS